MAGVARDADLGLRRHWYESRRRGAAPLVVVAVVLLAAVTALMCYGTARAVVVEGRADVALFVVAGCLVTGTALGVWLLSRRNRRYLAIYHEGLVFAGDRVTPVAARWDDVVDVRHLARTFQAMILGMPVGPTHTVTVLTTRGDFRLSDEFPAVAEIGGVLLDLMTRRLAPDMRAQIHDGESVEFGQWSLAADGLTVGEWLWEWADIADVTVRNGKLRVTCVDGSPGATIEIGHEESAAVNAAVAVMRMLSRA